MSYLKLGSLFRGITTTATAAGTTTLVASSKQYQQFTGVTTQTVVLPDATTLVTPATQTTTPRRFDIFNRSTGVITVNFNGGTLAATVPADSQRYFLLVNGSTAAGTWVVGGVVSGGSSATVSVADKFNLLTGLAGLNVSTDNIEGRVLKLNPEDMGGNYWTTRATGTASADTCAQMSFNGYLYTVGSAITANGASATDAVTRYNDDSNYWLARAVLPVNVFGNAASSAGGFGFSFGGINAGSTANRQGYKYTDSTNTWSAITTAPLALGRQAVGYDGTLFYLVGGQDFNSTPPASNAYVYSYDHIGNIYSTIPMTTSGNGRQGAGGFVIDGKMYFVGGRDASNTYQNNTDIVDFTTKVRITGGLISASKTFLGSSASVGFGYIFGGTNSGAASVTTTEQLNPATGTWVVMASMTTARRLPNGTGAINSKLYSIGGITESANTVQNIVEAYTPFSMFSLGSLKKSVAVPTSILAATLTNALTNNLPVQVRTDGDSWKTFTSGLDSVLKFGETLSTKFQPTPSAGFVAGGQLTGGITATTDAYNRTANSWAARASLSATRQQAYHFPLNGVSYVVGGTNPSTPVTSGEKYNDITNSFSSTTAFTTGRSGGSGTILNGYGYIVGGSTTGGGLGASTFNTRFNDATLSWTEMAVIPATKFFNPAGSNGAYILTWTGTDDTGTRQNTGYYYNDFSNAWVSLGAFATTAQEVGGLSLNGSVYAIGGANPGNLSTVYRYDFTSGSWVSRTGLSAAKYQPNCFRLDGFGYAAGGYIAGYVATVEEFNDSANIWTSKTNMTSARGEHGYTGDQPGLYRNYEVRVGIPALYAGLGSYVVVARATQTSQDQSAGSLAGYFVSGPISSVVSSIYDLELDSWRRIGDTTVAFDGSGGASLGGFGYISSTASGASTTTNVLNPSTWTWSVGAAKSASLSAAKMCALDGYLYTMRGFDGSVRVTTVQRFNQSTNVWSNVGNTTTAAYTSGVGAAGGFLFTCGDVGGSSIVERYNPVDNTKTNVTAYPLSISYHAFNGHLGSLWGIGGFAGANVSNVYEYRPDQNVWHAKPSLGTARNSPSHGSFGSDFMVGGGSGSNANERFVNSVKQAVLGLALEVK